MNNDEFKKQHLKHCSKLNEAYLKNPNFVHSPILPKAEVVYEKHFFFLDEPLLESEQKKKGPNGSPRKETEIAPETKIKKDKIKH